MDAALNAVKQETIRKYEQSFADKQNMAYAVIQALNHVINNSSDTTIQALYEQLKSCSDHLLDSMHSNPELGDRTLLSIQCLIKIYFRMAQKVDYEQNISEIKSTIHMKGINLAQHTLQVNALIRNFAEPHLREGMVSEQVILSAI